MDSALLANPDVLSAIAAFEKPDADRAATGAELAQVVLKASATAFGPSDLQLALAAINNKQYDAAVGSIATANAKVTAVQKTLVDANSAMLERISTLTEQLGKSVGGLTTADLERERREATKAREEAEKHRKASEEATQRLEQANAALKLAA